ncbi:110 kDa U5 small nuclear ribonucleoprotein component CLO-like [Lycium ferocissimum]|uniref:110 kDa U5 small nuclear ribonucleoprotein component CLO-like n=1 Tax=Lycium ferocissimum TaxID=112874 RepID=UPI002815578D|nr:110 kDa U5 small nuclear ribonucleoprotein component CLO-like [Lycium ferocissimum]
MSDPTLVRSVAVLGHVGHGKTTFIDMLLNGASTHHIFKPKDLKDYGQCSVTRYSRIFGFRSRARPASIYMVDSNEQAYLFNMMDTSGHMDFLDEMTVAVRLSDGVVVIVDAVEGVRVNTEMALKNAIQEGIPIVLVINKVDILLTELRLPLEEVYDILEHIIESVNNQIAAASSNSVNTTLIDPTRGNVCFASATSKFLFTLQSFAKLHLKKEVAFDADAFALRIWGDFYFDHDTSSFNEKPHADGAKRSFVEFFLEPLKEMCRGDYEPDVIEAATVFTDMLAHHIPSAKAAAARKVEHIYTGPKDSTVYKAMEDCDSTGPFMVNVTKLYHHLDGDFYAFGRVYSGEIMRGQTVRVLGEGYSSDDKEDMSVERVSKLWVYQACCRISISKAPPGAWVMIKGVGASIMKTATLCNLKNAYIFRPLQFNTLPVLKRTVMPVDHVHLPAVTKSFPLAIAKVGGTGECSISGTGELYLDCIVKELMEYCTNEAVKLKVADPVVTFSETVVESSSVRSIAETPNKRNRITMIAEPLDRVIVEDIENKVVRIDWPPEKLGKFFETKYGWDLLAAQSIWAFGPDKQGPNILLDDTLSAEVDRSLLYAVKDSIVQGFQWGAQEGPLGREPIRNVIFKLVDAKIAPEPLDREMGQIVQTARAAAFSAFLEATPKLMEPVFYVEV